MTRPPVLKTFALVTLALVFGGAATPLEGQSRGVLQATARVVDYGTSFATLKAAGLSTSAPHADKSGTFGGKGVHLNTARQAAEVTGRPESIVVTISYLQ
jgi:hypothetical protein